MNIQHKKDKIIKDTFSNLFTFSIVCLICISNTTLLITAPIKNQFTNSTVSYSYANFGTIPYGKTLAFDLINFG